MNLNCHNSDLHSTSLITFKFKFFASIKMSDLKKKTDPVLKAANYSKRPVFSMRFEKHVIKFPKWVAVSPLTALMLIYTALHGSTNFI